MRFPSAKSPPPRKPHGYAPVGFEWRQGHSPKSAFAVDEDALVVAEIAEFVRLDFVFLGFGIVHVAPAGAESPRAFHHALLADEIGGLNGVGFVGRAENHPVAKICKRRLKSAAGGARKVRHLPGQRELVSLVFVKPRGFVAR